MATRQVEHEQEQWDTWQMMNGIEQQASLVYLGAPLLFPPLFGRLIDETSGKPEYHGEPHRCRKMLFFISRQSM